MVGTGSGIVDIQCRIDFNADGVAALVAAATSPAPAINTSNNNTSAASIRSAQSRDLTHFPASHPSYSPHTDWYSTLAPRFPSGAHPHLSAHRPIPAFMLPNTVPNAPSHPHPPNAPSASYAGLTPQYIPQQQHAPLSPPKVKDYSLAGSLNLSSALAPPFSPTTSSTPNTPGALQHIAIASLSLVLYSGAFPISTPGGLPANGGPLNWLDMVTMAGHVHKVPFGARVVHLVTKPTVCKR
ncbi:hypothetical protein BC830DRAFT_498689 [Chytriomyces sp. MP71]|nr:hypothetical protein BC830DRAFT_498689 [Chytriomyces sp. MP71]